jgi:outer membrane protein assembly factor BamC
MTYQFKIILGLFIGNVISGCGVFQNIDDALPDHRADYGKSTMTAPLEIPPDLLVGEMAETLTIPETTTQSDSPVDKKIQAFPSESVLPVVPQMEIKREGEIRRLEIASDANTVWQKVQAFWQAEGFTLTREDPKIGILETEWKENRADIPESGLRKLIGGVLDGAYSTSTRDKFRTRLEPGQKDGTTAVYLTHRGVQQVSQRGNFVWQVRPADAELEAEMLRRLLLFMGLEEEQANTVLTAAKPAVHATIQRDSSGQPYLQVQTNFEHTWQRTGLALDRLGFTVEDRNRAEGVYLVLYLDPEENTGQSKGFWAGLFGRAEKVEQQRYIISLLEAQKNTQVFVKNSAGQSDETSERILTLLQAQLK